MRKPFPVAATLAATLLLPLAAHTPLAQTAAPVVANKAYARVIVKYRADSELTRKQAMTVSGLRGLQTAALAARIGIALTPGHSLGERAHVVTASGLSSSALAARIAAQGDVEYAVVDERKHIVAVPNDPLYASRVATAGSGGPAVGQWYLKPPGTTGTPSSINAEQAWDITTGVPAIVVAVLDTGLRKDHPDLQGGNVLPGYDMVSADGNGTFVTANDGDGRDADASDPGDFVTPAEANAATNPSDPLFQCTAEASSWHGTQTLGLIGATTNNGTGVASVGRGVRVMPVRVLGKCGGYDSDIVAGILWAAGIHVPGVPDNTNAARVINMSLGGTGACSQAYVDAVAQANARGAVVVASAGNSAGHPVGTPANCAGVIGVAGLRHVGDKVGFSDLGSQIAISAPGGNCVNTTASSPCLFPIMTTSNSGNQGPVAGAGGAIYTDSFDTASLGTSFSAPLVSGTVALMLSAQPSLTAAGVKTLLQQTARPFPTTGGTVSITTVTAAPSAATPVALAATEPPQCTVPTSSSSDQLECYCTSGTCGAGMLDAHAAVTAAAGGGIIPPASTARRVVSYAWSLVDGGGIVTALSGANTANVSATPTAAGSFTVSLTTVDDAGVAAITNSTITVAAAPPVVVAPPPAAGNGSSGGGALGAGWLASLLVAVLALAGVSRHERRRAVRIVSDPAFPARRR